MNKTTKTTTPSQRRAINKILRYVRRNLSRKVERINELEIVNAGYNASLSIRSRRTDCEKHSPRAALTEHYSHFLISRRGKIRVATVRDGLHDARDHYAYMLDCSVL